MAADAGWFDGAAHALFTELRDVYPGLKELVPREVDLLEERVRNGECRLGAYPALLYDVNMSQKRINAPSEGARLELLSPCVLPGAKLFHTGKCRLLRGEEMCRLQGLWFTEDLVQRAGQAVLANGAGNAFAAPVCGAMWLSLMLVLASIDGP